MNNSYIIAGCIVLVAILAFVFGSKRTEAPLEQVAKNETPSAVAPIESGNYKLNTEESVLTWQSEYVSGAKKEEGTVKLKSGEFEVQNGVITSGQFVIDLNTIESSPIIEKLMEHLKSPDFFDVATYPTATFTLKTFEPSSEGGLREGRYIVGGDLTVRGITKPISFVANIGTSGEFLTGKGSFAINRADWEIKYNSNSFFQNLGDKAIRDAVTIGLDLKAEMVIQ